MSGFAVAVLVVLGALVLGYGWALLDVRSPRGGWVVVAVVVVAAVLLTSRYAS